MNNIIDLSPSLSSDYEKLYESGKHTDVSIYVGKEPNSKIFLAHTLILCTRSTFLDNLAEDMNAVNEFQNTAILLEDVSPDVFEILLR